MPLRSKSGKCVALNGKVLFYLGLWPDEDDDIPLAIALFRLNFPRLQIAQSVYGIFSMTINVVQAVQEGLEENSAAYFCVLVTYTVHLVKICTLYFDSHGVQNIVRAINALQQNDSLTNEAGAKTLLSENLRLSRKFTIFSTFFVVPFVICLPLVHQSYEGYLIRKIPFRNWFIVDISTSPKFEVTLVIVTVFAILDNIILIFHDILFLALVIEIVGQFKILCYTLKNVKSLALKELEAIYLETNKDLLRLKEDRWQQFNQTSLEYKEAKTESSQVLSARSIHDIQLPNSLIRRQSEKLIKECVKHHQTLLSVCNLLESVFQPSLALLFISNLALGIAVAYVTTYTTEIDSQVMGIIMLVFAGTGEILMFCVFCDVISSESDAVLDNAYDCDWFDGSVSFKRSLLVIISRANQPVVIRVLTFLPITRNTFQAMVNSSYSLYKLLTSFTASGEGLYDQLQF